MDEVSDRRRNLAWLAGERAARQGKPASSCDRIRGTIYYDDWMDGFEHAGGQL